MNEAEEIVESIDQQNETPSPQEGAPDQQPLVADLTTKLAESKDQLLRAMAEVENIRRRTQKEKEDTAKFAISKFALEMLAVADNFRRALAAIPTDTTDNETLKHLVSGIEATERQLLSSFERFGIMPMSPMGQPFDPHFHRVMMEIEDPSQPAGTVVQIMQSGYMIHDRLLREALVAVSKGGPANHKIDATA